GVHQAGQQHLVVGQVQLLVRPEVRVALGDRGDAAVLGRHGCVPDLVAVHAPTPYQEVVLTHRTTPSRHATPPLPPEPAGYRRTTAARRWSVMGGRCGRGGSGRGGGRGRWRHGWRR